MTYQEEWQKHYDELLSVSREILSYYTIDKTKPWGVFIWTKVPDDSLEDENVFDILANEIIFYTRHDIIEEAKPIIERIQIKLREFEEFRKE